MVDPLPVCMPFPVAHLVADIHFVGVRFIGHTSMVFYECVLQVKHHTSEWMGRSEP